MITIKSVQETRDKILKGVVLTLVTLAVLGITGRFGSLYAQPEEGAQAPPPIQSAVIQVGDLQRSYLYHAPENLADNPVLVLVFHGGGIDAEKMRAITAYEFERLAEAHGFIVAYPNGYGQSWNDCRKNIPYPAKRENIDDIAFVRALIGHFRADYAVDPSRVFAMGVSNGGHLAYRLALEMPGAIAAIAAIGANLPAEENRDCEYANQPLAVMIINGTEDPINPYGGGAALLPNGANLGRVLSAEETAAYFRQIAGHAGQPTVYRYPDGDGNEQSYVERFTWSADSLPEVSLLKVAGGGHTIPQAKFKFPEMYGATNSDINSLEEIWKFFERQGVKTGGGFAE